MESRALPVLQRSRTLGELDALIHREGLFPRDARRRFVALIIARLAGNPDFEALAQQMQHSYEKGDKETTDKLQRLIDHLRDKAAPAV
ncbi:hypothetical protein [Polaromonas hydrogenivorans]|uniref:Uncharacterized protein n=1 Tax=Polaromonas hydrogenivorans TaxID=335476 RepID=A0AAU7LXB2_9BURK